MMPTVLWADGTTNSGPAKIDAADQASLRDAAGFFALSPALKRRAIVSSPSGTGLPASAALPSRAGARRSTLVSFWHELTRGLPVCNQFRDMKLEASARALHFISRPLSSGW